MEKITFTIPSYAVPYLYYGPDSAGDMSDSELAAVDSFLEKHNIQNGTFDISEDHFFTWRNDIFGALGADCVELSFYPALCR
jgi:hypothetical protein